MFHNKEHTDRCLLQFCPLMCVMFCSLYVVISIHLPACRCFVCNSSEVLEEALVGCDPEGPLCELLFFFLSAIFQALAEEQEEVARDQVAEADTKGQRSRHATPHHSTPPRGALAELVRTRLALLSTEMPRTEASVFSAKLSMKGPLRC